MTKKKRLNPGEIVYIDGDSTAPTYLYSTIRRRRNPGRMTDGYHMVLATVSVKLESELKKGVWYLLLGEVGMGWCPDWQINRLPGTVKVEGT